MTVPTHPFAEDFGGPRLGPDWHVDDGVGAISTTESPGSLRYRLTGISMGNAEPAPLVVHRSFTGTTWELRFRASCDLPAKMLGRQFYFRVRFGDVAAADSLSASFYFTRDFGDDRGPYAMTTVRQGSLDETLSNLPWQNRVPIWIYVTRYGDSIRFQYSVDGANRRELGSQTFDHLPQCQTLKVYGLAYDSPTHPFGIAGWADMSDLRVDPQPRDQPLNKP